MQAKEVDVRVEIHEEHVLPLRVQQSQFAYSADLRVLDRYYQELWRCYLFVSPEVFRDPSRCKAVVDLFCDHFQLRKAEAYRKVRGHVFREVDTQGAALITAAVGRFLGTLSIKDLPTAISARVVSAAGSDSSIVTLSGSGAVDSAWEEPLSRLLDMTIIDDLLESATLTPGDRERLKAYRADLERGGPRAHVSHRGAETSFAAYRQSILQALTAEAPQPDAKKS
jgi:hypothetical protein